MRFSPAFVDISAYLPGCRRFRRGIAMGVQRRFFTHESV
jgi:hypothetical protein